MYQSSNISADRTARSAEVISGSQPAALVWMSKSGSGGPIRCPETGEDVFVHMNDVKSQSKQVKCTGSRRPYPNYTKSHFCTVPNGGSRRGKYHLIWNLVKVNVELPGRLME